MWKFLGTGLFLAWLLGANAQVYDFKGFSLEEGLATSGVYDLLQDHEGYLWIGTEGGGVCRFNGQSFECFTSADGLAGDMVRCLFEDSRHRLWIGTQEGGISVFEEGKFRTIGTAEGLPSPHVRTIVEDDLGNIWVGTLGGGIALVQDSRIQLIQKSQLPHTKVRSSVADSLGNLWFCTDGGLVKWDGDSFETYTKTDGLPHNKVLSSFRDMEGNLWFGCERGIVKWDGREFTQPDIANLYLMRIKAISQDANGFMWFGTRRGIFVSKQNVEGNWLTTGYDQENGLSNSRIRDLYRDRSNAMWIGTYFGGINRFCGESFARYGAAAGFPENNVTSVFEDQDSSIWIGTFDGSVYVYDQQNARKIHSNATMEDNTVMCFADGPNGDVYFGTRNQGAYVARGDNVDGLCLPGKDVLAIAGYRSGHFFGTGDGVFSMANGKLRYVMMNDTACHVLENVGDTLLLIGTDHGLFKCRLPFNGQRTLITGTSGVEISSVSRDGFGYYWVGTAGDGLLRCNLEKVRKYRNSSYLRSFDIHFAQSDDKDNLWVGTSRGLQLLELDPTQSIVLNDTYFSSSDGFSGGETNRGAAIIDSQNQLWMGTVRGVVSHGAGIEYPFEAAPYLTVDRILLNDEEVRWSEYSEDADTTLNLPGELALSHTQNSLTFVCNGRDIRQPEDVRYQFRLLGHDGHWSDIKSSGIAAYHQLPPGEYTFLARSQNAAGFWNEEPISISFSIKAPLYERAWFIILVIALLIALIFGISTIRVRILRQEKMRLERKVLERTLELQEANQKSERLLLNILPQDTAEELKQEGKARTRHYPMVSVLFSDFKGFTSLSEQYESEALVEALDLCFKEFDRLTDKYHVEKIKTIGDAYMCAAGLPAEDEEHASNLVSFAFEMQETMNKFNESNRAKGLPEWHIRIGIHSGPVIAGVVGEKKFAYDIWGDTVNIAARMESSGSADRVNISHGTYELVRNKFNCTFRGEIEAKNKGKLKMYFIDNKTSVENENIYQERG